MYARLSLAQERTSGRRSSPEGLPCALFSRIGSMGLKPTTLHRYTHRFQRAKSGFQRQAGKNNLII